MAEDETTVVLTDIFKKVVREIEKLEADKKTINDLIDQAGTQIRSLDEREAKLRADVAELAKKEAELKNQKVDLEKRLDETKKKYEKMAATKKSIDEAF